MMNKLALLTIQGRQYKLNILLKHEVGNENLTQVGDVPNDVESS